MMRLALLALLVTAAAVRAGAGQSIKIGKDALELVAGGETIGRYLIDPKWPRPILWPLKAPGGAIVTRAWPMEPAVEGGSKDHPHQKSVWFVHGDVIPEGLELKDKIKNVKGVDFWSEAKGHGRIVCLKAEPLEARYGAAVSTQNEWRTADGTKIMDETRVLRLFDFGKARLIVFEIDLHASVCPITFGDTKEGCMGVRVNDVIRADKNGKGTIQNADGKKGEKECRTMRSAWCDYSGPIDDKTVGIAILDDPKNPYPVFWHVRGYGLMAANPFARKQSEIPGTKGEPLTRLAKGEHLRLRYGILVHEGDAETGRVAGYYERFLKLRQSE